MKIISTQTEIESQPNPLTNSASTCWKRCSLPCSWPIFIFAAVIFLLYLLYCPHNTIGKKKHKEFIQVFDHFCETQTFAYWNLRSSLRNKLLRIYYRNPKGQNSIYLSLRCNSHHKGIAKVSHRKGIAKSPVWLDRNSQACESLQEKNGGEGLGYLQMLLWGQECHLALACGWCLEPFSFALLPWGTLMVDHQPRPPLIGI